MNEGVKKKRSLILATEKFDGEDHRITIGDQEVVLTYPGAAHTHGDLWIYLPKQNIVETRDLLSLTEGLPPHTSRLPHLCPEWWLKGAPPPKHRGACV